MGEYKDGYKQTLCANGKISVHGFLIELCHALHVEGIMDLGDEGIPLIHGLGSGDELQASAGSIGTQIGGDGAVSFCASTVQRAPGA